MLRLLPVLLLSACGQGVRQARRCAARHLALLDARIRRLTPIQHGDCLAVHDARFMPLARTRSCAAHRTIDRVIQGRGFTQIPGLSGGQLTLRFPSGVEEWRGAHRLASAAAPSASSEYSTLDRYPLSVPGRHEGFPCGRPPPALPLDRVCRLPPTPCGASSTCVAGFPAHTGRALSAWRAGRALGYPVHRSGLVASPSGLVERSFLAR